MKSKVSLSQCMIVKNEELNIRQALSWGKGIVCEQIVVDTGSEDNTAAIAERMGAKVYHYPWADDFSAAKNFAIDQASGEWIAFLDADEYYNQEDAEKLYGLLKKMKENPSLAPVGMIQSAMLHLDDAGKVFSTTMHIRIFKNDPLLRYHNKIHESLRYSGVKTCEIYDAKGHLSIYHTGYAAAAYRTTKKAERNIELLNRELEENPEDYNNWSYLGDSLLAVKRIEEAREAYEKVLLAPAGKMEKSLRNTAYASLMRIMGKDGSEEEVRALYQDFQQLSNGYPDVDYWMGLWMYWHDKRQDAIRHLELALEKQERYSGMESLTVPGELCNIYKILMQLHLKLEHQQNAVRYAVLGLRMNRYQEDVLATLLLVLKEDLGQRQDTQPIFDFLAKLYDFSALKDKLYVMKLAKQTSFPSLDAKIYQELNEEEKKLLNKRNDSPYRLTKEENSRKYPMISCLNETDMNFLMLMEEIDQKTEEVLIRELVEGFQEMERKQPDNYTSLKEYYANVPNWGELLPEEDNYEALERRVREVKDHRGDFIWLYSLLSDYQSKRVLLAILDNWLHYNFSLLYEVKETEDSIFDTNLIPSGEEEVFVNMGADTGIAVQDFIRVYGDGYQEIHCYENEPDAEVLQTLKNHTRKYRQIKIHEEVSAVAVSLDDDIKTPVTFVNIDVPGAEQEALLGCAGHMRQNHPKLMVNTCHNYETIWNIPRLIAETAPGYRFYMRYYGYNLIPSNCMLIGVCDES